MKRIKGFIFRRVSISLSCFFLWAGCLMGMAVEMVPVEIRAPLMTKPPSLDGVIGEEEWADACSGIGLTDVDGRLYPRQGTWWIGTDGKMFYVAIRTEAPPKGALLSKVVNDKRDDRGMIQDDAVELWLSPRFAGMETASTFQFMGNSLGGITDIKLDPSVKAGKPDSWDGPWQFKNSVKNGWWESEMAIPLDELTQKKLIDWLAFRIARSWKQPSDYASTEAFSGGVGKIATMSRFRVDGNAPRVRMLGLGDWMKGELDVKLGLANPGKGRQTIKMKFNLESTGSQPPVPHEDTVELGPGEKKELKFQSTLVKGENCRAVLVVSSADGKTVWFSRQWQFRTEKPKTIWEDDINRKKGVEMLVAYSPYQNKVRARVNFAGLENAGEIKKVIFSVYEKEGQKVLAESAVTQLRDRAGETMFDVPDLKDGTYEVRCSLEGKALFKNAAVRTFERKHFEWEHNTIGISDKVIEPFEPLKVEGQTVKTIYREHEMNGLGLWNQVKSEGKLLLTGPMDLRATANGRLISWVMGKPVVVENKPTQVVMKAEWNGGGVQGSTVSRFDYDGLMTVDLTIKGTAGIKMDALDLVIPLSNLECPYMHTVGAGIYSNYGGKVPSGEGEIWDNTRAETYEMPNQFLTYIWVGGIRRGVCWYADSDCDWVVAEGGKGITMTRRGNVMVLVFHLIGKSTVLDRPRTFTFGLQATPVKPRPANWRTWNFFAWAAGLNPLPNTLRFNMMGTCTLWGGISHYGDLYPRDHDYSIIKKIVEIQKRGGAAIMAGGPPLTAEDMAFNKKWNEGYQQKDRILSGKKYSEIYEACTLNGLGSSNLAHVQIPYTNIHDVGATLPETLAFLDEWSFEPYTNHELEDDNMAYVRTSPVQSYRDYALWHYKKLTDLGFAGGFNWDNTFPLKNYNPFSPGVRMTPEGKIHPAVDITSMRELIKREAVLQQSNGRRTFNMPHMSNTAIVPKLAFATIGWDWESKYGADDFQDRFPEDYIFAATLGEQSGTVPAILSGCYPTKEKTMPWLTRTLFGTTLVYELRVTATVTLDFDLAGKIYILLDGFGYGLPDCKVYRYWEDPPFKTNRKDLRCLLLERKGRLLLISTDFGEGGPCKVQLDSKALALKGDWSATNAETREKVAREGDIIVFHLKKHDFNIIQIESTTEPKT